MFRKDRVIASVLMFVAIAVMLSACGSKNLTATDKTQGSSRPGEASKTAQEPYFKGKTITLLIPFSPGGSTDIRARMVGQFLSRFIPGSPTIIPVNKPGGGGALVFNELARAKPDGLTMAVASPGVPVRWVVGEPGHDYDLRKMTLVASYSNRAVAYIDANTGIKNMQDMLNFKRPIRVGVTDVKSTNALFLRFAGELLGIDFKFVPGYSGFGEVRLAVMKGEVDVTSDAVDGFVKTVVPLIEQGKVLPLFQQNQSAGGQYIGDPRVKDVPTLYEVYRELKGASPEGEKLWPAVMAMAGVDMLGTSFWLPEGTPAKIIEDIANAFKELSESNDYKEEVRKVTGSEDIMLYKDDAKTAFDSFAAMPDEVKQLMR